MIGVTEPLGGEVGGSGGASGSVGSTPANPSLSRVVLTLESAAARQMALQHILNALQVTYARDCVIASLDTTAAALPHAKDDFSGGYSWSRINLVHLCTSVREMEDIMDVLHPFL